MSTNRKRKSASYRHLRLEAHGRTCPYCKRIMHVDSGRLYPTRDHVVPLSRRNGEPKTRSVPDVIMACNTCNQDKGNRMLSEWYEALLADADKRSVHVHAFIEERCRQIAEEMG